jgi:hypothetical protein
MKGLLVWAIWWRILDLFKTPLSFRACRGIYDRYGSFSSAALTVNCSRSPELAEESG